MSNLLLHMFGDYVPRQLNFFRELSQSPPHRTLRNFN